MFRSCSAIIMSGTKMFHGILSVNIHKNIHTRTHTHTRVCACVCVHVQSPRVLYSFIKILKFRT